MRKPAILTFLALTLTAAPAAADEIVLVDGRKLFVEEIVEETPDGVTVRVPYGTFKVPRSRIVSITKQGKFEYYLAQGDQFSERGQLEMAIAQYRKAAELKPDNAVAKQKHHATVARLGNRLLSLRRHSDARKVFEELRKLDPGNLDARAGIRRVESELGEARALITEAEALSALGRHDKAVEKLEVALEEAPELREEITARQAAAWRAAAEDHYAARQFDEAAAAYARAVSIQPDLAGEVEGRYISSVIPGAVKAINGKNWDEANRRLAPLLGFAPTNPRVLYMVGSIRAGTGDLAGAADCFARGLGRRWSGTASREEVLALHKELGGSFGGKGLQLDKPFEERFTEVEAGDWKKAESARFVAYHHNAKLAALVLQTAEYHLDRVAAGLGLKPDELWAEKVPIYIYADQKGYREASGQPEWSGGTAAVQARAGKLVSQKIMTFQTAPRLLNSVLPHELGHMVFMAVLGYGQGCPLALHEGVAICSELAFRRNYYREVLKTHLATESTMTCEELLGLAKYPEKPNLFYAQGASLVEYLSELRGAAVFRTFCRDTCRLGAAKALETHYGFKDLATLDKAWKVYAKGQK